MGKKRIAVVGLGVVSCFGNDVDEYYQNLLEGKSGINRIQGFDVEGYPTQFAGEITDFDPTGYVDRKMARRADKYVCYSVVAGKKAMEQAEANGPLLDKLDKKRCGVIVGSGMGGMSTFFDGVNAFRDKGPRKMSPFFVPYIITNMGGATLAMELGLMGPNYSISAADHIRKGDADLMIAGGVEAACSQVGLVGFIACRALSTRNEEPARASRPWDKGRDGFVLGEGAGVVVLMDMDKAIELGAEIIAEYAGGGMTCDAYHMTEPRPDGEGVANCIRLGLEDGGVSADEVNYVNAHATSTPAGDMAEIEAVKKVLPDTSRVTINGTKSMIGHGLGAAAGMEAVVVIKAIQTGKVHPTINLDDPEEGIAGFDVPTQQVEREIEVGMSNAFGFGGHNATVLFRRYRG
jgi:3-oxoacyl-[acyl-carrier-protein] synthase II